MKCLESISSGGAGAAGLGLTEMKVDDSCTLCNACVELCPHRALTIDQGELIFQPEECTGCGYCAQICPEHSITLTEMDGPMTLSARTVYRDEMIRCTRCNTPFVSAKMLKKVSETLKGDEMVIRMCPVCRQSEIYEKIFGNNYGKTPSHWT